MSIQIGYIISVDGASMGISGGGAASKSHPRLRCSKWMVTGPSVLSGISANQHATFSGLDSFGLPLKTGHLDLDSQDSVALQRTEVLLDREGGGLMRLVRAAGSGGPWPG